MPGTNEFVHRQQTLALGGSPAVPVRGGGEAAR